MKELAAAAAWAIVYLASGPDPVLLGTRVPPDVSVPAEVRGLLVPEVGVVQLEPGAAVRPSTEVGRFTLEQGRARVVARGSLVVEVGDWLVTFDGASGIIGRAGPDRAEVCAAGPGVRVALRTDARDQESVPTGDAVHGDMGAREVAAETCLDLEPGGASAERALDGTITATFRRLTLDQRPQPTALPDVVADLSGQVEEVESEWADRLDQGPQREAQSCGCSEDGGSGGGLDPSGSGPSVPDPEHPDPGQIRIRLQLPRR